MKKILIIIFLLSSFAAFSQAEKGLPTLGVPELTDMNNSAVEANNVKLNQPLLFRLPVLNMDMINSLPKGNYSIKIGLGSRVDLQKKFNLATSSLSSYFEWAVETTKNGEKTLTGNLIKDLPANFSGEAVFELQGNTAGLSEITMEWIKPVSNAKAAKPQVNKFYITTRSIN